MPRLRADDFNRPSVTYTTNGSLLGWNLQASVGCNWSLTNHEIYVNNADASRQTDSQMLVNTRIALQSGNWSASTDLRDEIATRWIGLAFMVQDGGTNYYQLRIKFGSQSVQVLRNDAAGGHVMYSGNTASEIFGVTNYYTLSVWSTIAGQFQWSITNAGANVNWTSMPTNWGYPVASGSFTDTTYTNGFAGLIKSTADGSSDVAHFDNFYVREIAVPPITQPHPRLLVMPASLLNIHGAIAAHVDPRYSTWLNLKSRADVWSNSAVANPYTGQDSYTFYQSARGDGGVISKLALAYLVTGDTNYASKAKSMLLAWAQATPLPGADFPQNTSTNFGGSGMLVARGGIWFVYAYDWLYNTLSPAENTTVTNWLYALLPSLRDGINEWNTPFQQSATDPRGWVESSNLDNICFYGQLYQNHVVSPTMMWLAIGYAVGDASVVQFAVDSKENPRSYRTLFDGNIMMSGEVPPADVNAGDPMTPPPQDGEIYDRYRHIDTSNGHTNGAGLGYAGLSLAQMTVMTEILADNGLNFYQRSGAHGENMQAPFTFYSDFYRTGDSSIKGGFYTGESLSTNQVFIADFEVAHKYYPTNANIQALLNSVNRGQVDPGGYVENYFCYPSLTHGVVASWTGTTTSDFENASNWEAYVAANDTTTDIAHFDVVAMNQPTLTQNRALAGLEFGVSGLTLSAANGQLLTLGARGISSCMVSPGTNTITVALNLEANQAWTVNAGSTLVVSGAIGGGFGFTNAGPGTVMLFGTNTYQGPTVVNSGKLVVNSAQMTTNLIAVSSNATLGVIESGISQLTPQTLILDGATTLEFSSVTNLSTAPVNAGTLVNNGPTTINVLSGSFIAGQSYPLIHYGAISGSGTFLLGRLPAGVIGTLDTSGNNLVLNVSSVGTLVWTGAINGNWDTNTLNWSNSSGAVAYTNGNTVLFDDTASGSTLVMNISAVMPGSIFFLNNSLNYTLSGSPISGSGSLTKNGAGTLAIFSPNNYTGGTAVNAGTVTVYNPSAFGATSGGTTVAAGTQVNFAAGSSPMAEPFTLNGGSLVFVNSGLTLSGKITLGANSTIGGLYNVMSGPINLSSYTLTVAKNKNVADIWNGPVSGAGGITLAAGDTNTSLTLNGTNTYTGSTMISSGTLILGSSGSLNFIIGAAGNNNALTGTGQVVLNGTLRFDLTGAGASLGNQWSIVNVPVTNVTYGAGFKVAGFTMTGSGLWTATANGANYEFSQANGALRVASLVPRPAISSVQMTGSTLILNGSNGTPNGTFTLRSSTNLLLVATNWVPAATGYFDANGGFSLTNAINPFEPQRFYLMSQP